MRTKTKVKPRSAPYYDWAQIKFVWQKGWVSDRVFCQQTGIDRGNLREHIRRKNWTRPRTNIIGNKERELCIMENCGAWHQADRLLAEIKELKQKQAEYVEWLMVMIHNAPFYDRYGNPRKF